jgi:hypothetical protein
MSDFAVFVVLRTAWVILDITIAVIVVVIVVILLKRGNGCKGIATLFVLTSTLYLFLRYRIV